MIKKETHSTMPDRRLSLSEGGRGSLFALTAILLIVLASNAGCFGSDNNNSGGGGKGTGELTVNYLEPVMLKRALFDPSGNQIYPDGVIGYEPSLAVDSTGAMYYTAHKDLQWQESWDYFASWFFVSTDNGNTWQDPPALGWKTVGKAEAGDEGDIAIDAQDRVYFVDTTLVDNNLHVFSNQGKNYDYTKPQGSFLLDDRPWITASGNRILHYLGNNGVSVNGARVWYYKSTDGGLTWTTGVPMTGGWATIDAERFGDHVYIVQENAGGNGIWMRTSANQGDSWSEPVYVGPLQGNGVGEGMPIVFSGANGTVYATWQDSPQGGNAPATLYFARSEDYGAHFEYWNISMPEGAIYLYPTVNVCQYGEFHERNRLGVAFYATTDIPVNDTSKWYLYGAVAEDPKNGTQFNFQKADVNETYTGSDLHALHDFFEIVIAPDGSLNIAYQRNVGNSPYEAGQSQRYLMFVRGEVEA